METKIFSRKFSKAKIEKKEANRRGPKKTITTLIRKVWELVSSRTVSSSESASSFSSSSSPSEMAGLRGVRSSAGTVLNGKVMRKVGVEVMGLGALKLTGFLRELLQQSNIKFDSLYTVRTVKEAVALCMEHCHSAELTGDDAWFKTVVLSGGTACLPGLAAEHLPGPLVRNKEAVPAEVQNQAYAVKNNLVYIRSLPWKVSDQTALQENIYL